MDNQVKLCQLESELQGKICEINQLKSMLLTEIDSMHQNSKAKKGLFQHATKLVEYVGFTREVLHTYRNEIMKLPAMLGEQIGGLMVKIRENLSKQRSQQSAEMDKLRNELSIKSTQNQTLQLRIVELTQKFEARNFEKPSVSLKAIQQSSTDQLSRSPAIEYPAVCKLDTIAEDDQIIVLLDDYRNKYKARDSDLKTVLKTEPSQDNPKVSGIYERSISYRKFQVKPKSRSYIQDFRNVVQVTSLKHPHPLDVTVTSIGEKSQVSFSKVSEGKFSVSDISSQNPASGKIELTMKNSHQESREIAEPHFIELGGMRRSMQRSQDLTRESREKIQVTQKDKTRPELMMKDCNLAVKRPASKQKIKMTLRDQDLKKSHLLNQSKPSKTVSEMSSKQIPTAFHFGLQEQLQRVDIYLGDRKTQQKYEGTKKDLVRWGRGRLQYINGLVYQGEFKDNLRHGYGILTLNGKRIYEGEWQRDRLCGKGFLSNIQFVCRRKLQQDSVLRNCIYEGFFDNSQFQGQGCLHFSSGDKVSGQFNGSLIKGQFVYSNSTGEKVIGML